MTGDDAVLVARAFAEAGCDLIDVSTGQTTPDAQPVYGRMYQTPFSDQIRNDAGLATILEVADAQSLLAQAEVQDQLARVDVWRALLAAAIAQGDVAPFLNILRLP